MTDFVRITCYKCKIEFGLNREFHSVAKQAAEGMTFYCPNGHGQVFSSGPTEAEMLRQERDRLKQQRARLEDEKRELSELWASAERRRAAARGQVTRLKNRAKAGLCPCCNRHFTNLERHIASKHPEISTEPAEA